MKKKKFRIYRNFYLTFKNPVVLYAHQSNRFEPPLDGITSKPCQGVVRAKKEIHMNNPTKSTNLKIVHNQWASRPDDQRFLSVAELKAAVLNRRRESWTAAPKLRDVQILAANGEIKAAVYDPTHGEHRELIPTNWAFGQLAQQAKAPGAYLQTLPAELAAINLQWGLEHNPLREDGLFLAQSNGHNTLRAITSPSYGRVWDHEVVEAVERVNVDGRWKIPAASYATSNPRRASTLYASDRDVFMFLVDDTHPLEVDGQNLFRGFVVGNSEVGAATFFIMSFVYQFVCDNRTIWGATNVQELRIKHTGGAPQRFAYEGARYLKTYSEESTGKIVATIKAAESKEIEDAAKGAETVTAWLQRKGFTKTEAKGAYDNASVERGQVRSVWDIVNGVTGFARSIPYTNERLLLEKKAGQLLESVAA